MDLDRRIRGARPQVGSDELADTALMARICWYYFQRRTDTAAQAHEQKARGALRELFKDEVRELGLP